MKLWIVNTFLNENETYFKNKITNLTFDSKLNGFDIAKLIKDFKN